ncbi:hypothetical protein BJX99DRAFT_255133 [Aspergillus californicus]
MLARGRWDQLRPGPPRSLTHFRKPTERDQLTQFPARFEKTKLCSLRYLRYKTPLASKPRTQFVNTGIELPAGEAIEEEIVPDYDARHYFPVESGSVFNQRYEALAKLGWGSCSTVWLVRDLCRWRWQSERYLTLKVGNCDFKDQNSAAHERRLEEHIASANPKHSGRNYVRTFARHFEEKGPNGTHMWDMLESRDLFAGALDEGGSYRPAAHLAHMIALLAAQNDEGKLCSTASEWYGGPFFDEEGNFLHEHVIPHDLRLEDTVTSLEGVQKQLFLSFPLKMLQWLPEDRKTAKELAADAWLSDESIKGQDS